MQQGDPENTMEPQDCRVGAQSRRAPVHVCDHLLCILGGHGPFGACLGAAMPNPGLYLCPEAGQHSQLP